MRRISVLCVVAAIAVGGWVTAGQAQEGTPAAEAGLPAGLAFETLGFGAVATLPETPAYAILERVTLDPGVVLPSEPGAPNLSIFLIESGTLTVQSNSPFSFTRATALAEALAAPGALPIVEEVGGSAAIALAAGDTAVFLPDSAAGELRNDGEEPVVLLVVNMAPAEALAGS